MSNAAKKILIGLGILDVILVHISLGYSWFKIQNLNSQITNQTQNSNVQYVDTCGVECRNYVDQAIQAKQAKQAPQVSPTPATKVVYQTAPKTKVRTTSYVTIPGSGNTTNTDWTNVTGSEFYFNPADYPGLVSVYFEANMKLFNGSGLAYVRLFDVTHGIGVQGSEVNTNSGTDTVVESGQISFWAGRNLIRVQIKSQTAEQTVFNSGRLRITTEN